MLETFFDIIIQTLLRVHLVVVMLSHFGTVSGTVHYKGLCGNLVLRELWEALGKIPFARGNVSWRWLTFAVF